MTKGSRSMIIQTVIGMNNSMNHLINANNDNDNDDDQDNPVPVTLNLRGIEKVTFKEKHGIGNWNVLEEEDEEGSGDGSAVGDGGFHPTRGGTLAKAALRSRWACCARLGCHGGSSGRRVKAKEGGHRCVCIHLQ